MMDGASLTHTATPAFIHMHVPPVGFYRSRPLDFFFYTCNHSEETNGDFSIMNELWVHNRIRKWGSSRDFERKAGMAEMETRFSLQGIECKSGASLRFEGM